MAVDQLEPNFNLVLPRFNKPRYQDDINKNMRVIGALLAKYIAVNNVTGVWSNSTVYAVDDVAVDEVEGQLYRCLLAHTSAAAPTIFSGDRDANPGTWASETLGVRARGEWSQLTAYALGDFVVYENRYAVCVTAHTSTSDFDTDVDSELWEILIDLTSVTEVKGINDQAGTSYTLVLTDANKLIRSTGSSGHTLTVPPESSVNFPIRTQIMIGQFGTGQITIAPGSGVTIRSEHSYLKSNARYSPMTLLKVNTNEWWLMGSLAP